MKIKPENLAPVVFCTLLNSESVVVTSKTARSEKEWELTQKKFTDMYVEECLCGKFRSPQGRCQGGEAVLKMFERHPEWRCNSVLAKTIKTHTLVE